MTDDNFESQHAALLGASFFLSLVINGAAMITIGQAGPFQQAGFLQQQRELAARRQKVLDFEFVEAPPIKHSQKPGPSNKISDRDSLAQDVLKYKKRVDGRPHVQQRGLSDQLAQKKDSPSRLLAPPVTTETPSVPQVARPAQPAQPAQAAQLAQSAKPAVQPVAQVPAAADKTKQAQPQIQETESKPILPESALESPDKIKLKEDQSKIKATIDMPIKQEAPPSEPRATAVARPPAPAVAPLPGLKAEGLTSQDKITTQEMVKTRSFGAKLEGITSFEATGCGMGEYMKNLKEKVWLAWFPYLAFQYPQDYHTADAVIGFIIDAKGQVKAVKILENQGSPVFAAFCVDAVQRASGFGPLPKEILALIDKDEIEIKFGFHYR